MYCSVCSCRFGTPTAKDGQAGRKKAIKAVLTICWLVIIATLLLSACTKGGGSKPGTISTVTSSLHIEGNTAYCMGDSMAFQPDCMIRLTATLQTRNTKDKWVDYEEWYVVDNGMMGATVSTYKNNLPAGTYRLVVVAMAYDGDKLLDTATITSYIRRVED